MTDANFTQNVYDFAVVGGGVMGVSTALALQRSRRVDTSRGGVIILEGLETKTASKGITKIIRTPYMDREYVSLAEKAKDKWEAEFPYSQYYRQTGWIQEVPKETYTPFHKAERPVSAAELSHILGSQEFPGIEDHKELWLNEDIGVADATHAVEAVAEQAAKEGVIREQGNISKLLVEEGVCHGVERTDGTFILAKTTIVAIGPWTPALLEESNIRIPLVAGGNVFDVTAVRVATLDLVGDEYERFKSMPILAAEQGEIMPPHPQHRRLQITSTTKFRDRDPIQIESNIHPERVGPHRSLLEKFLPEMKDRPLQYIVYPELRTPKEHPLVDRIPDVAGLHLAVGGSYHSFKFLPVFGDVVVDCLRNDRAGVAKRWVWKRNE